MFIISFILTLKNQRELYIPIFNCIDFKNYLYKIRKYLKYLI
jgi:hypothetical protein